MWQTLFSSTVPSYHFLQPTFVPGDAQALVVLAGNVWAADETRASPELGTDTLYRCLHAATLYQKANGLPIL